MTASFGATYSPELMDEDREAALLGALERFYLSDHLAEIWPVVYGDRKSGSIITLDQIEIVVLPLDRIGAPAGASGSNVYVAYYAHRQIIDKRRASKPIVIKIGDKSKLAKEMEGYRKWPGMTPADKNKFAFPIDVDNKHSKFGVLIAPFHSLSETKPDGNRNSIKVSDLWRLLENKEELLSPDATNWDHIRGLVKEALEAVEPAHACGRASASRVSIAYAEDYDWYLRDTGPTGKARNIPERLFGTAPETKAFGRKWPNPTAVADRIIEDRLTFQGIHGAVHGDLHPKNIVLSSQGHAQIIDFGWAWNPRHVIVDYVLLDLNLRGTTLPSQINESDTILFAGFLHPKDDPSALHPSIRERATIIKDVIWATAKERAVDNWDEEYLIPLFLVGYGLLVHLDNARNQFALKATVLQLARHIEKILRKRVAA